MKGILLAGGLGTRLWPMTLATSKQLLPVYDKPAIYYPLSTLLESNIREILIISSIRDLPAIQNLLGDGKTFGVDITYREQAEPKGIAEALLIGKEFLEEQDCILILGDNLFFGIKNDLLSNLENLNRAQILVYRVPNPTSYGNIEMGPNNEVLRIVEKPKVAISSYAVTGFYLLDNKAVKYAENLIPSQRGELEITDLLNCYRDEQKLDASIIPDGAVWMDMGTISTITAASEYVRIIQNRQGVLVGSPHFIALEKGWISKAELLGTLRGHASEYAESLRQRIL